MDQQVFSYDEAFEKSKEYFNDDDLAATVFLTKYALRNEKGEILEATPDMMHRRLAKEFARIEAKYPNPMSEDEIFALFDKFKRVVPQGSPMSAIGNPYKKQSLSNCFVIASPEDSYGGICHTDQEEAQIMKRRGGVGFDVSTIRPKGQPTDNAAVTTDGIGVFLERFSNTCREVAQGGRRGALMLTIDVRHPEIETFVTIKRDLKKVTGANMSVKLTDDFMNAALANEDFQLQWPVNSDNPEIVRTIKARKLWDLIIDCAWDNAEPGLLFWDTVQRMTPADAIEGFQSISTNPCQPGFATVLTPEGICTFDDIDVGSWIWTGKQYAQVVNKMATGTKKVYEYKTTAGRFVGTPNHRVVRKGKKLEVQNTDSIDTCQGPPPLHVQRDFQDVVDGWVLGDGSVHSASNDLVFLCLGENDEDFLNHDVLSKFVKRPRPGIKSTAYEVETTITPEQLPRTYERAIPSHIYEGTISRICGFLQGLYSANGSICGKRVTLKASSFTVIRQVQDMLSALGIKSYYTTNKSSEVEFSNGQYVCRESYDLNISTDRNKFAELIGFVQKYKQEKLAEICKTPAGRKGPKNTFEIREVTELGEFPVYDITVDAPEHTYWTGGLLVSNCGEIVLSAYDACRLMLLNVTSYVSRPFAERAVFESNKFYEDVQKAQRLMDDLIDLEIEAIDRIIAKIEEDPESEHVKRTELDLWKKIRHMNVQGRRTGLGVTGIGDACAMMGYTYGSPDSIEFVESVYQSLALGANRSSFELGKERGAFPAYEPHVWENHPLVTSLLHYWDGEETKEFHAKGRRNICLTTTAPAGSVSTLTQTTSGIEPAFLLEYTRRKKINPNEDAEVDFVDDSGDKWQEYKVYHHGFKQWLDLPGNDKVEESPYHKATSADIDWEASVDIQAAAQKWVEHSISKTCNLPAEASRDLVSKVYLRAWQKGCKGFTVYREGCRTGVLVKEPENATQFVQSDAPKRPDELPCKIEHATVRKDGVSEDWIILVGLLEGKPYEVFGGLSDQVKVPKKYKEGIIVKHRRKTRNAVYDLILGEGDDQLVLKDIGVLFDNPNNAMMTRLLSWGLRHGGIVQYATEQLLKEKDSSMFTYCKAVSRVLKEFIPDGAKTSLVKVCDNCGAESLAYQEGCITCTACGWSKCS